MVRASYEIYYLILSPKLCNVFCLKNQMNDKAIVIEFAMLSENDLFALKDKYLFKCPLNGAL